MIEANSSNENPGKNMGHAWMVLSVTSIGALISTINSTTLNVALPTLTDELHATIDNIGWVIMSYMVSVTILAVHAGKISDMFGRKKVYIWGVFIFVITSLLAGFANSVGWVIFFRVLQGAGAAAMMSNTSAMVVDAFPIQRRGLGLGINGMAFSIGAILGPVIGGFLLQFNWRWIFWFNVPIGLFLIFWAWRTLPDYGNRVDVKPFDIRGTVTLLFGLISLLGVVTYGIKGGWENSAVVGLFMIGLLSLGFFIWLEKKAIDPIVQLDIFRNRVYSIANANTFLNALARMTVAFILIFYFQVFRDYTPLAAGTILIPLALAMAVVGPLSGRLSDKIGSRIPTAVALLISSIGFALLGRLEAETSISYIIMCITVIGIGTGMFQSPNGLAIMNAASSSQRSVVAGTRMMLNNMGMLFSLAISSGLLSRVLPDKGIVSMSDAQMVLFLHTTNMIFLGAGVICIGAMILTWMWE